MVTGETQTASVHYNDNHLKHLNLTYEWGGRSRQRDTALCSRQRNSSVRKLGWGEFTGMFEWENNPIPSLGCVLKST